MEARNRALPDWFSRARLGQLKLPRFQRFEAWSHEEVVSLLETVLQELPCGAALILQVGDKEPFESRQLEGTPAATERVNEHLLDGQQRLTALWKSLNDLYPDRTYFVCFKKEDDSDNGEIPKVESVARGKNKKGELTPAWIVEPEKVHAKGYIPIPLLRPGESEEKITQWCQQATGNDLQATFKLLSTVNRLRAIVATYNLPFLDLPAATPRHVALDIFIKMNTSSVELSAFDIVVAQVEAKAGDSLHELLADLKKRAPNAANYTDISQWSMAVAAMRQDMPPTLSSFQKMDVKKVVDDWDGIIEGIRYACEVLEEERIFDSARLPTYVVLYVLAAIHSSVATSLDAKGNARNILRRYLWRACTTRRYENSSATRSLQDLRGLKQAILEGKPLTAAPIFDDSQFPLPTLDELKRAGWPKKKEILARGILAVSIRLGAYDLADGSQASRDNLGKREYHHLFPDALLGEDIVSFRALNCALVTWNTNRNISAKEPLKYLRERVARSDLGEPEIRARLASHAVPFDALNVGGYEQLGTEERKAKLKADFDLFLDARAQIISGVITKLCEGQSIPIGTLELA